MRFGRYFYSLSVNIHFPPLNRFIATYEKKEEYDQKAREAERLVQELDRRQQMEQEAVLSRDAADAASHAALSEENDFFNQSSKSSWDKVHGLTLSCDPQQLEAEIFEASSIGPELWQKLQSELDVILTTATRPAKGDVIDNARGRLVFDKYQADVDQSLRIKFRLAVQKYPKPLTNLLLQFYDKNVDRNSNTDNMAAVIFAVNALNSEAQPRAQQAPTAECGAPLCDPTVVSSETSSAQHPAPSQRGLQKLGWQ
jgi:hypothetical protein